MNVEKVEQDLLRLSNAWVTAELHRDMQFLEDTLADDFVGVGPHGFMLSKEQWLERYKSGDLKYVSFGLNDVNVRMFGDAAILIGRQTQNGEYKGHNIQGQFRVTLVFVEQKGHWQLVSLHLSPVAENI